LNYDLSDIYSVIYVTCKLWSFFGPLKLAIVLNPSLKAKSFILDFCAANIGFLREIIMN